MESIIVLKCFILSILTSLGLISDPKIQKQPLPQISAQHQSLESKILPKESQEIIDINPVENPHIVPSDLERKKMFSESFCGPAQSLLFAGIRETNLDKIVDAIDRLKANVNKPTNCWYPLDEAIEQAITGKHDYIIEYLLKHGARASQEQINRLEYKSHALETNIVTNPNRMERILEPVNNQEEQIIQGRTINAQIREEQGQCRRLILLLMQQLTKQRLADLDTQISATSTTTNAATNMAQSSAPAAASSTTNINLNTAAPAAKSSRFEILWT